MFANGRTETFSVARPGRLEDNSGPRLLVIDDLKVHRIIICRIAERAGLQPVETDGCAAEISVLSTTPYCGATLDLSLGKRTGTQVLGELARYDFRAPIIIISGSDPRTADEAQQMGIALGLDMREPVVKPADLASLRRRLIALRTAAETGLRP